MKIFQKIFTLLFSIILLLCATGLSVLAEESTRVYPEYIEPKVIQKELNYNFTSAKPVVNAQTDKVINTTATVVESEGNKYASYSFIGGVDENGKPLSTDDGLQSIVWYKPYVLDKDYLMVDFDFKAEGYTDGTSLISIDDYEGLSDEKKKDYYPSYQSSWFYYEFVGVSSNNIAKAIGVKRIDGKWYVVQNDNNYIRYPLPERAGVWTHITQIFKLGNTVTYTDRDGVTLKECSMADFKKLIKADAVITDGGKITTESLVSVNLSESRNFVYVNGQYAFEILGWANTGNDYKTYDFYNASNAASFGIKWGRIFGGTTMNGKTTGAFSVGFDNFIASSYSVSGEKDILGELLESKSSIISSENVIFNTTYNATNTTAATVTGENGTYAYYSAEQAYNAVKEGETIELLTDAEIEYKPRTNITYIKTNGYKFKVSDGYAISSIGDGVYKCSRISSGFAIDGVYYANLASAKPAIKDGSIVYMYSEAEETLVTDKAIFIYTNGYEIDVKYETDLQSAAVLQLVDKNSDSKLIATIKTASDLASFFTKMEDGDTARLLSDVITDASIFFTVPGDYTIDFNGYDYLNVPKASYRSFTLDRGVTLNVKSSRPGSEIYNYSPDNVGAGIFYLVPTAANDLDVNLNIDGENLKTFSSILVYTSSSKGSGTVNINGGEYYKINGKNGIITTGSSHVYNITGASLIANKTAVFAITSATADITVRDSIVYAHNAPIVASLQNHTSRLYFENSLIASPITSSTLYTGVTLGHGCRVTHNAASTPYTSKDCVMVKTKEEAGFAVCFPALEFTDDGTLIPSDIRYTTLEIKCGFDRILLRDGYIKVTWIHGTDEYIEFWKEGISPECPLEIPAANEVYSYEATIVYVDEHGNPSYEVACVPSYTLLMNLTLYTDFTYNIYIPSFLVEWGCVSSVKVNGEAAFISDKIVKIGNEYYYVLEIRIIPSLADRTQHIVLEVIAPDTTEIIHEIEVSIPSYAESLLNTNCNESAYTLMDATLAYIKSATAFFGTDSGIIGDVSNAPAVDGNPMLPVSDALKSVIKGATLTLDSTIKITFYYTDNASGKVTFTYPVGGIMTEKVVNAEAGGIYQISLRARDLLSRVTVTVGTESMRYGIDNYIYYVNSDTFKTHNSQISNEKHECLKTLLYNLYAYAEAARGYVSDNTTADVRIDGNYLDTYVIVATNSKERNMAAYIQNAIYKVAGVKLPIVPETNAPAFRFATLSLPSMFYDSAAFVENGDVIIASYLASFHNRTAMKFATEYIASLYGAHNWRSGDFLAIYSSGEVYYSDFGAVGDGVTNDSIPLHAAHEYANVRNYIVRGDSRKTYYIDHNYVREGSTSTSHISIATETDWTGSKFIFDDTNLYNGVATGAIMQIEPAYKEVTLSDEAIDAHFPGRTIDKDTITKVEGWNYGFPAMIFVTNANHKNYRRYEGGELSAGGVQKELIVVDEYGNIDESTPFLFDYDDITSVTVYRIDSDTLTIRGGTFTSIECMSEVIQSETTNRIYASRGLSIKRSNVILDGVEHYVIDNRTGASKTKLASSGFFAIGSAANVTLRNCVATGHIRAVAGSYDISISSSNNVLFENVTQSNYFQDDAKTIPGVRNNYQWGVMGSNGNKNITYDGCLLTRFDAHTGLYNGKIINSRVASIELIGGGDFLIENTTIDEYSPGTVVMLRSDYGSTWNGTFTFRNVTINSPNATSTLFSIMSKDLDFGYQRYVPNVILDNVRFGNYNAYTYVYSKSLTNGIDHSLYSYPFVAPSFVTVKNNTKNHVYYVHTNAFYANTVITGATRN